jgi:hypothetical protein
MVEAELLAASVACRVCCPFGEEGTVNPQENDPFPPLAHEPVMLMLAVPSIAATVLAAPKPVPFSTLEEPTAPELLVNEMEGVTRKPLTRSPFNNTGRPGSEPDTDADAFFSPAVVVGTLNAQDNDPFASVTHELRKPKPTPLRFALVTIVPGKKPDPFIVLVDPTAPELLANEMETLREKLVAAELALASAACTVFDPEMVAGRLNEHESDPAPFVLHGLVNVIAAPPSVAVMLAFGAKAVPFKMLLEPTMPEVLVNEIEAV